MPEQQENIGSSIDLAWAIRRHAVNMTHLGKSSHVGSILSIADILAVLYRDVLDVDPKNPRWSDRDRFILSKGHAGAGLYAALAESGFFPVDNLARHYQNGSNLSGHVSHTGIPGVEFSTGSLGHGLPVACGMALSAKRRGARHRIVVQMSDGECDEGSNWEAFLFAAHHGLDNLLAIIDFNGLQSIRTTTETLNLEPFAEKLRCFNWCVHEVDGHDHGALRQAFDRSAVESGKPTVVVARTVKGCGVSFMENSVLWHYRTAQGEEFTQAMDELERRRRTT